jgi:hypothetical protein
MERYGPDDSRRPGQPGEIHAANATRFLTERIASLKIPRRSEDEAAGMPRIFGAKFAFTSTITAINDPPFGNKNVPALIPLINVAASGRNLKFEWFKAGEPAFFRTKTSM